MIVRLAHWKCRPSCWGEDQTLFREGAVPIMERHEGFLEAMLLAKEGSTARIALTVWSGEEAYRKFAEGPDLKRITAMFAHMYCDGALPEPAEYEVRAHGKRTTKLQ